MKDNVRAAIERLRQDDLTFGNDRRNSCRMNYDGRVVWEDVQTLLSEHLADDDEPVTVEWLESVGFKGISVMAEVILSAYVRLQRPSYDVVVRGNGAAFSPPLATAETRGDVRRLCAALGIELKEI